MEAWKHFEELNSKNRQTPAQLLKEFDRAYETNDHDRAWNMFCRARSRAGNSIVDGILDRRLNALRSGQQVEAEAALNELSFAADLEIARAKDKFTADVAA